MLPTGGGRLLRKKKTPIKWPKPTKRLHIIAGNLIVKEHPFNKSGEDGRCIKSRERFYYWTLIVFIVNPLLREEEDGEGKV